MNSETGDSKFTPFFQPVLDSMLKSLIYIVHPGFVDGSYSMQYLSHLWVAWKRYVFLPNGDHNTVNHFFVATGLDYCNKLCFGLCCKELQKIQEDKIVTIQLLSRVNGYEYITSVLCCPPCLLLYIQIQCKAIYKPLNVLGPYSLRDHHGMAQTRFQVLVLTCEALPGCRGA